MLSIHHTDSVSNDSTVAIGLDIGTYFGYSVTLFALSLVMTVILVTWAIYIPEVQQQRRVGWLPLVYYRAHGLVHMLSSAFSSWITVVHI